MMMRRRVLLRWTILGLAAPMLAVSLGCGKAVGSSSSGGKPRIVCTVGMVADVVRNVVGDRARVENLIGEGVDPHLYKP
ncbi:MAG: zinc ABC transporter substrate-binding protein, partial [Phycisphaerales bacterium]|nr:zinc ABC transporter substrate-binding protein [Phycisphaerales bacterium]